MQRKMFYLSAMLALWCLSFPLQAQEKATIKGKIVESKSGKGIQGVNVHIKNSQTGTITDANGFYEIPNILEGNHTLVVSYVGYESQEKIVYLKKNMSDVNFEITQKNTAIQDVEVIGGKPERTEDVLKLAAPLRDIPVTTSSISGELIQQKQFSSINDAMQYTTGINPTINYGGFQTFNMRGFRGPVIMVDGARDERMNFSNSAPVTSLAAVERIEYLKGPASVLYGHSAVGGIINIVRKQPSPEFTANMSATYGSWDTKEIVAGAGGKLSDKLNYRFDIGLSDNTGWRENSTNYFNGYFALDYQLNKKNKIEVRFGGNDDLYGTETGLPAVRNDVFNSDGTLAYNQGDLPTDFKRDVRYNDPFDYLIHENVNASVKFKHDFSKKSHIQFHASYSHDIIDYFSTEALSYLTDTNEIYDQYYMSGEDRVYICLDSLQRTFPFRFSHHTNTYQNYLDFSTSFSTANIQHKLLVGYYLMLVDRTTYTGYNKGVDVSGAGLDAKISVVNPIVNQGDLQTKFSGARNYDEVINSIYVQDFLNISNKLKALLALRSDYYHMIYQTAGGIEGEFTQTDLGDKFTQRSPALTYRAGLVYKPVSSLSIYSSYSTFFQPNRRVYSGDYVYLNKKGEEFFPAEGEEFFDPKKGYQIEGGLKYSLNNMLELSANVFYIEQNNIIESLGENTEGQRVYGQVGLIGSKGMEIEAKANPFLGFNVIAGYGYTNASYLEYAKNEYSESSLVGNFMTQSPMNTAYAWCYYKVPEGALKKLSIGLGANYRDVIYTHSSNIYTLPAYWLLDANVGYSFDRVYMKFGIYNILDKEYYSNYIMSTQYIPGAERNYKFTIGIKL